jgi:anti-repressor protein
MDNLITITEQNGSKVVSARELHRYLQNSDNINTWFKRQSERAMLEENIDFTSVAILQPSGQKAIDYALTLSASKEIAMLNGGDKGKQARQYFIAIEKQAISRPRTHLEVIQSEMALLIENESLKIENNKMKPRSEFVDKVFNTDALIDIGEVAKILNLPYGRNTLFNVLREKGIFFKNKNEPFQQYVSKGYFEVKEKFHEVSETKGFLSVKTFATQKGLAFIAKTLEVIEIPINNNRSIA